MHGVSRRLWLAGTAATAAGLAGWRHGRAAQALAVQVRPLAGIDSLLWEAAGELEIVQVRHGERLTVEAEPAVLARLVADMRDRRLRLGFGPGPVQTQQPVRFRVELNRLARLETRGSGSVRIGPLSASDLSLRLAGSEELQCEELRARLLEVRLEGAGEVRIGAGEVERQAVVIAGSGRYIAPGLASRRAELAIDGSGDMSVAVSGELHVRIAGSGEVVYRGDPRVVKTITGAGDVRREGL
ncbi:DUF2807 domain-containing protein [Piscinibacter sp. XHJ-5]|uniref:GIN domain-containing protein n=1 Tax=Piscinibacter sp. XHJ-5 TaxID=3037797 RepID=UPI002452CAAF|nr:DUF2807 domain-containing protein [Piscinibacter sp. XHJ-5]